MQDDHAVPVEEGFEWTIAPVRRGDEQRAQGVGKPSIASGARPEVASTRAGERSGSLTEVKTNGRKAGYGSF